MTFPRLGHWFLQWLLPAARAKAEVAKNTACHYPVAGEVAVSQRERASARLSTWGTLKTTWEPNRVGPLDPGSPTWGWAVNRSNGVFF